jgi:FtsZ-interacting cell division protein ZipA
MTTNTLIVIVAVAVVAIVIAIWIIQKKRTRKLRSKFGSEYDRLVGETGGNAHKAEAVLDERQKRVGKLIVRPLSQEECARFTAEWRTVQDGFVDEPRMAVWRADALVNRALQTRGFPMADFDEQAANVSVEHPQVVENYRVAHDIALRDQQGRATTEELRRAMQHYRSLFEHVLDMHAMRLEEVHQV